MTATHGLSENTVSEIRAVLGQFAEVKKAMLFGSRAKATHKPGSDIDLALTGDQITWQILGRIESAFDDRLLPYSFSLIMLNDRTDPEVAAHIRRVGLELYARESAPARA
jgi:predicted nucleotidyltransferase